MKTEKEKMLAGELYLASDPELVREREAVRRKLARFNRQMQDTYGYRQYLLEKILGSRGEDVTVQAPFYCDYGYNIHVGSRVYFNFNCVILDVCRVDIGNDSMFGPNVQIYTATHSMYVEERRLGTEFGKPIVIGSDVWVGGGSIICPGVTIGDGCVIGAGSVVTRDVPPYSFAAGNPCRVIRDLRRTMS